MSERRADRRTRLEPVRGTSTGRFGWLPMAVPILLAVAVAVATVVVTPGDDAMPPSALPDPTPIADASDEAEPEGDNVAPELELAVVDVILVRDPFDPVVPEPEEAPTDDPEAPADPDDPGAPAPTDPTDPADPNGDAPVPPGEPRCVGERELVCGGQVVTLEEITNDADGRPVAVIQVDDFRYVVRPGEPFATGLELVSIEDGYVRIIFGDQVYRLLLGSTPLK